MFCGMWIVMMAAMMLPTAIPMLRVFAHMRSQKSARGSFDYSPFMFLSGYVLVWTIFSVVAALMHVQVSAVGGLNKDGALASSLLAGLVCLTVGVYQATPLKHACLVLCQSPMAFFLSSWRNGTFGALLMGIRHGVFCVGCCWALMLMLFVVGFVSAAWCVFIAFFVLLEKLIPGRLLSYSSSLVFVAAGGWLVIQSI